MIDSFLEIKRRGKRITTRIRDDAWQEAQKYFGIFVLISNQKSKVFEALAEYRLREKSKTPTAFRKGRMMAVALGLGTMITTLAAYSVRWWRWGISVTSSEPLTGLKNHW